MTDIRYLPTKSRVSLKIFNEIVGSIVVGSREQLWPWQW